MTEYFELLQFFGGYLNPDWPDEYADEWAALDDYLRDSPGVAPAFRREMQAFLDEPLSDEELQRILFYEFGCAFSAEAAGWKYRDWLKAISDHAAKASGQSQAS